MLSPPARILIILHGAIGDVVRAMPLVMRIRKAWPESQITWAVEPIAAPLLKGHPAVDKCIIFHRDQGVWEFFSFLRAIRAGQFDVAIDLQRHLKSGMVSWASGAEVRLGFNRANTKEMNWVFNNDQISLQDPWSNKVRQYLAFAETLKVPDAPIAFGLQASEDEAAAAKERLYRMPRPRVAAFIGSTWPSRFWWPQATAKVLHTLHEQLGAGGLLLGASGEQKFAAEVLESAPPGTINLVGQTTLRELVAIFEQCDVAFGPDSGPMHIAAAMGLPVVSLWGATSPRRSAPWGSEHLVQDQEVACSPCYLRRCPIERFCMKQIQPERVSAVIAEVLV